MMSPKTWRRGEGVEPSGNNISRQAGFEDRWGHRAPSSSKYLILLMFLEFSINNHVALCYRFVTVAVPIFGLGQIGDAVSSEGFCSFNQPLIITLDVLPEHDVGLVPQQCHRNCPR